jgi:hypothetical protein
MQTAPARNCSQLRSARKRPDLINCFGSFLRAPRQTSTSEIPTNKKPQGCSCLQRNSSRGSLSPGIPERLRSPSRVPDSAADNGNCFSLRILDNLPKAHYLGYVFARLLLPSPPPTHHSPVRANGRFVIEPMRAAESRTPTKLRHVVQTYRVDGIDEEAVVLHVAILFLKRANVHRN